MPISFSVPQRFEAAYRRALIKLISREIPPLVDNENDIDDWLTKLYYLSEDENFIREAYRVVSSMVRDVNIHNSFKWRDLAQQSTGGSIIKRYIYETAKGDIGRAITNQLDSSTNYIASLPAKIAIKLDKELDYAREQGATGKGLLNILRRRFIPLLSQRINMLGRTEPHKANTAFTRARSSDLNLQCFKWQTSEDTLVRFSHRRMNGVIVFWRDLPSPESLIGLPANLGRYAPGDCPNCRCSAIPQFSVEDIFKDSTRIRVFYDDRIHLITKSQFMKIAA